MSEEQLRENFSENPNAADFRPQDLQLALVPFVDMLNHQGGYGILNTFVREAGGHHRQVIFSWSIHTSSVLIAGVVALSHL